MNKFYCIITLWIITSVVNGQTQSPDQDLLGMPPVGTHILRILSPQLLELVLINKKEPDPSIISQWNFIGPNQELQLPALTDFIVKIGTQQIAIESMGFKRRVLYAPLATRDLRIANSLFLNLATPIAENQTVEVKNPSGLLWESSMRFIDTADPLRWNPAIHVNQSGYQTTLLKKAMVGYYLGNLGEMNIDSTSGFNLVEIQSGNIVYHNQLTPRQDVGFRASPPPYQKVLEADFSDYQVPGQYWLVVPGLGASYPFLISEGIAAASARAYALGLYHQRCGTSNDFPFTRFVHGICHHDLADIPTETSRTWDFITQANANYIDHQLPTTPQLKSLDTCLYPFIQHGQVDVSGGHHDAGDYSKYTINSALLIHSLVFAVDAFPEVGQLDNLGIPESGDGKSDLLAEAKWEADFLAKMQDLDGGFYFLVYPRDRKYENDVLPDQGDHQVVWPKTTAVTASAVAALAQTASSPLFKQQFPIEAAFYLEKAKRGWNFLEKAIATYGKDGAYQKITHYGNTFRHNDELAWAAAEMFCATGDPYFQQKLIEWLPNPTDHDTYKWNWWHMYEGYGCAIRSYAFAARTGRVATDQVDENYLSQCESEILAAGNAQLDRTIQSAYGTSFSLDSKVVQKTGWYFSTDQAFDMAVAYQLNPNTEYINAIVENMNYELGCNPVNTSFITGLGWKRQREIVHQYAQNDHRTFPPSGLPVGNLQNGSPYLYKYRTLSGKNELSTVNFPRDNSTPASYAYYDRWSDTFNTSTEFVVYNQARSLATTSFLMAQTSLKNQPWQSATAQIKELSPFYVNEPATVYVDVPGIDLSDAIIVWEAQGQEPSFGNPFSFTPQQTGSYWVEAEIQWPDGRRAFAINTFNITINTNPLPVVTIAAKDSKAHETGPHVGIFTFNRTGNTSTPLKIAFIITGTAKAGTDYCWLSGAWQNCHTGYLAIPKGASSKTLNIRPINDTLQEELETAIISIAPSSLYRVSYPTHAKITIEDND